ncbi:hypothetical protein [Clostridium cochlearium]|uniref:Uncharacterized protein n=1 Tax=Clostridium cochlearium TaxID=1494 RepID=A0A7Y3V7I7_CLOCO|nr:hypothetical protein [Clostridium cochlearium]NOH14831.1 hypothetical protein [Clostridium cochlearium]
MERFVNFYTIYCEPLDLESYSTSQENTNKNFIRKLKTNLNEKDYLFKKHKTDENFSVAIQIDEIDNDYIFGIIGKLDDLENKALVRARNKDNILKTGSISTLGKYIENFTYFYIRFSDLCCAVLNNNSAPSFTRYIKLLLKDELSLMNYFKNINVIPRYENNICNKISRFVDLLEINFCFDNESSLSNDILNINDIYKKANNSIQKTKVSLTLKNDIPNKKDFINSISEYENFGDFCDFKIKGIDEYGAEQCADIIQKTLTKKIFIDIDDSVLKNDTNHDKIKKELELALSTI